jgi:hypothetical protein
MSGQQEGPGNGERPSQRPEGRAGGPNDSDSGGGDARPGGHAEGVPPDPSRPTPTPESGPSENPGDSIAPDQPQSNLVLRKLHDLLKDDLTARQLEQETGLSRAQMEQFAKKFEKAPQAPAGEGRDIAVSPGQDQTLDPSRTIPDPLAGQTVPGRNRRGPGLLAPDPEGGNRQGIRSIAPQEYRSQFDAYRKRISRSAPAPAPAAPATSGR